MMTATVSSLDRLHRVPASQWYNFSSAHPEASTNISALVLHPEEQEYLAARGFAVVYSPSLDGQPGIPALPTLGVATLEHPYFYLGPQSANLARNALIFRLDGMTDVIHFDLPHPAAGRGDVGRYVRQLEIDVLQEVRHFRRQPGQIQVHVADAAWREVVDELRQQYHGSVDAYVLHGTTLGAMTHRD